MSEKEYAVRSVPSDAAGRLELLATRPRLWEYLLFGNVLLTSRAAYEEKWRDYLLGYTLNVGAEVAATSIPEAMTDRLSYVNSIAQNLEKVAHPLAQSRAFGESEEDADPVLIEHMAKRLIDIYGRLLEWAEETRALRVPEWAERLKSILAQFASQPIQRTHDFVDEYVSSLERAIRSLAENGSSMEKIELRITYEIDDNLLRQFNQELDRVKDHIIKSRGA